MRWSRGGSGDRESASTRATAVWAWGHAVSDGYLDTLGARPAAGRLLVADDHRDGRSPRRGAGSPLLAPSLRRGAGGDRPHRWTSAARATPSSASRGRASSAPACPPTSTRRCSTRATAPPSGTARPAIRSRSGGDGCGPWSAWPRAQPCSKRRSGCARSGVSSIARALSNTARASSSSAPTTTSSFRARSTAGIACWRRPPSSWCSRTSTWRVCWWRGTSSAAATSRSSPPSAPPRAGSAGCWWPRVSSSRSSVARSASSSRGGWWRSSGGSW